MPKRRRGITWLIRSRWAIVVAVALCVGFTSSACSNGTANSSGGSGSSSGSDDGTLTIAVQELIGLNPATTGYNQVTDWLAYEPLIRENSNGSYSPGLASSWKYVGTGNTHFEMTIRSGAEFADGTPVTAQAVVNSLKYSLSTPGPVSEDYVRPFSQLAFCSGINGAGRTQCS